MRSRELLAAMGALALVLPASMATANETSGDGGLANLTAKAPGGEIQSDSAEEFFGVSGKVTAMVELKNDPVVVVRAEKGGELTTAQEEKIESELPGVQDEVATTIEAKGGAVKNKMQLAFNDMRVTIDSNKLKDLKSPPEVKAIHSVPTYERSNVHRVPMIGVSKVWESTGGIIGYTGEDVRVVVIDIGTDYTHATFGGPGAVGAFNKESVTKIPNSEWFSPNAPRVKGGVNLVGDEYNGTNTPMPDDNPIDCTRVGHGTRIAGAVGGIGVLTSGKIYIGAYDQKTHENEFKVGPGVAPKAGLYAAHVFGRARSTSMTTEAINWAVKNKVDVINMSPDTPYGKRSDADVIASSNVVATGVVVLASAGNYGSQSYLTGSPASGAGAIFVAASDPMENYPGAQLAVDGKPVQAMNTNNAKLPVDAPMHMPEDASGNVSLGCADSDYASMPEGPIVITVRGNCVWVARAVFGQKHKVATVVTTNSSDDYASYEGRVTGNPSTGEQLGVTIPPLTVKYSDGTALAAIDGKQMTFAANTASNPGFTKYSDLTSASPHNSDPALRPSVATPGVSIISARIGSGNGSSTLSNTSMAVPHVTGAAAPVKQAHPSWNPQEILAAIVSTVNASEVNGYGPACGGGLVDPMDFTTIRTLARGGSNGVKDKTVHDALFSFDYQESSSFFEATKAITLVNKGNSEVTFSGEVKTPSQSLSAQARLSISKVTVPAGGTVDVTVTLTMGVSDAPSNLKSQNSQNLYGASGNVQFASGDKTLSVPCLIVPRSTTKMTGETSSDSSKISLQNQGGTYDISGFLFSWGTTDPKGDLPAEAIEVDDGVDITNIEVVTTTLDGEKASVFTINNHACHSSAVGSSHQIPIDNNSDSKTDCIAFSTDSEKRRLKVYNDVPEVFIYNTVTRTGAPAGSYILAPSDSSTALLTVKVSSVGATGKFQYEVVTYGSNTQTKDATDSMAIYDLENHSFNDGQSFQVPTDESKGVPVAYDKAAADDQKSLGWMAVAFDNDRGAPEAVTGSLADGGISSTVSPTIPNPTVTPTNPNPTGSAFPDDPNTPVPPVPTRVPLKPGLSKTGDLG